MIGKNDGPCDKARFDRPSAILVDRNGHLIIADRYTLSFFLLPAAAAGRVIIMCLFCCVMHTCSGNAMIRKISMSNGQPLASLTRPSRDWK